MNNLLLLTSKGWDKATSLRQKDEEVNILLCVVRCEHRDVLRTVWCALVRAVWCAVCCVLCAVCCVVLCVLLARVNTGTPL